MDHSYTEPAYFTVFDFSQDKHAIPECRMCAIADGMTSPPADVGTWYLVHLPPRYIGEQRYGGVGQYACSREHAEMLIQDDAKRWEQRIKDGTLREQRAQDHRAALPSAYPRAGWVTTWQLPATCTYHPETEYSGKWLAFLPPERLDDLWQGVQQLVWTGALGRWAKIATTPSRGPTPGHAACIYTYDWRDSTDVFRIGRRLAAYLTAQQLHGRLFYKANEDTSHWRYSAPGQRLSKYRLNY